MSLHSKALSGDVVAQFELGELLHALHPSDALRWWRMAGEQGHRKAQLRVGIAYLFGYGVNANPTLSRAWLLRSSTPEAHFWLGKCYEQGIGVEKDQHQAMLYYRRACAAGNPDASCRLGILEMNANLLQIAAEAGHAEACYRLALCHRVGFGCEKSGSKALECLHKAGAQGHILALHLLALKEENKEQAKEWFRQAALQGHIPSQHRLAKLLREEGDMRGALVWYAQLAHIGDPQGIYMVGACLYLGTGVDSSEERAMYYFEKASAKGEARAAFALGLIHWQKGQVEKSMEYLTQAAVKGHLAAQHRLGWMLWDQKREMSMEWLLQSACGGHGPAQYDVGCILKDQEKEEDALYFLRQAVHSEVALQAKCEVAELIKEMEGCIPSLCYLCCGVIVRNGMGVDMLPEELKEMVEERSWLE